MLIVQAVMKLFDEIVNPQTVGVVFPAGEAHDLTVKAFLIQIQDIALLIDVGCLHFFLSHVILSL